MNASNGIPVRGGTFIVAANGFADGPSQALSEYLIDRGAKRVVSIAHPLVAEGPHHHLITDHLTGTTRVRTVRAPVRIPYTYALDPLIPLRLPRSDGWFGFNCLATARGLMSRRAGLTQRVVHWSVDFVPNRFGNGPATKVYESIDRWCCVRADARVDLSLAALRAREAAYGLVDGKGTTTAAVVPMGAWLSRTPKADSTNFNARRIVFLGHLVPRMGVGTLLDALDALYERGIDFRADIIGGGPLLDEVRARVARSDVATVVTVHGFVEDHRDVEALLAAGTVAVAPYDDDPTSFSRFADPGKLKAYLGAGLPIVMTAVPPIAEDLATYGGAEIVENDGLRLADSIAKLLADPTEWERRRVLSAAYARRFDWDDVLSDGLHRLGFSS